MGRQAVEDGGEAGLMVEQTVEAKWAFVCIYQVQLGHCLIL